MRTVKGRLYSKSCALVYVDNWVKARDNPAPLYGLSWRTMPVSALNS
jgi:hypothetical protein